MKSTSFLEQLQKCCAEAEIWWDASPTRLLDWTRELSPSVVTEDDRRFRESQVRRFFDSEDVSRSLLRGVTTNPRLIAECIYRERDRWQSEAARLINEAPYADAETLYWRLYKRVIVSGARSLESMWRESDGRYGWVCAQVDPRDTLDADRMYRQGRELAALAPNIMVKVPGSKAGYDVIEQLVAQGISINNTFSYTVPQLTECLRAIESGLRRAGQQGVNVSRWRSVITFMIGRFGAQGDLVDQAKARDINLSTEDIRWAEIAMFKRFHETLARSGVPAKLLLSSMKYDAARQADIASCWHIEKTAGSPTVYTFTPDLLNALLDAGDQIGPLSSLAHAEPVPGDVLSRLMLLPYFANAYSADGLEPAEFHHQGTFIATAAEACGSVRRMIDFVSHAFQMRTQMPQPGEAFMHAVRHVSTDHASGALV